MLPSSASTLQLRLRSVAACAERRSASWKWGADQWYPAYGQSFGLARILGGCDREGRLKALEANCGTLRSEQSEDGGEDCDEYRTNAMILDLTLFVQFRQQTLKRMGKR